jgi:hypothetical protein
MKFLLGDRTKLGFGLKSLRDRIKSKNGYDSITLNRI